MLVQRLLTSFLLVGALVVLFGSQPIEAQSGNDEFDYDTRAELQKMQRDLRDRLAGLDRGSDQRARVRARLERVRRRLEEGDFRPGDAVEIHVPGSDTLSGVFQVTTGDRLPLPVIGDVDLGGVLYSETDSVVRAELTRYVKAERIRIRPLKRVAVLGAVGNPGYYDVPPSTTISDLLMRAGGPTQRSNLDELQIRRDGRIVASAQKGLREATTLAELGVERGDQVRVPESGGNTLRTVLSVIGGIGTVSFAASEIF